jgi:hypothetical protein
MNAFLTTSRAMQRQTLLDMHCYRRPAGSKTERRFIRDYLMPLGIERDDVGNVIKRIGDSPILWSCHTDTVHRMGGIQRLEIADDYLGIPKDETSNCLGADDTIGVWLMREMILAKKPGLYIFHRAEECGGLGSEHIATNASDTLAGIEAAIALDRRGLDSVITRQGFSRCCSNAFADSLAKQLPGRYKRDEGGVFTDTANYVSLIGECTNLSVGYHSEHSKDECLDLQHAFALREALLELDTTALTLERKPSDIDDSGSWWDSYDSKNHWSDHLDDANDMLRLVKDNPDQIADLLEEYGFDADSLAHEIHIRK